MSIFSSLKDTLSSDLMTTFMALLVCFWRKWPPFTFPLWKSATLHFPSVMVFENEWSTCESDTFQFSPREVHLEEVSAVGSAQLSYASFDPGTPDAKWRLTVAITVAPLRDPRLSQWPLFGPNTHSFSEKLAISFPTALREKSNNANKKEDCCIGQDKYLLCIAKEKEWL